MSRSLDAPSTIFSLIAVGTLGVAAFLTLPAIVIGMAVDLGFSDHEVGRVSTFQLLGLTAGSVVNLWLVRRLPWRHIALLGVAGLLVADLTTILTDVYHAFAAVRFVSGIAGGIAISFAAYALGNTKSSNQNFGWFLTFQVCFAIIAVFLFPKVIDVFGIDGVFFAFSLLEAVAVLLLLPLIPELRTSEHRMAGTNDTLTWVFCHSILLALICFYVALGGFWTYIAPIGIDGGLNKEATGTALSFGLVGGLAGAYMAATVNIRFGRILPVCLAIGAQFVSLAILISGFDFASFVVAASLFCFGWYMLFPYELGLLAALDRDGRSLVMANALAGLGSGIGPFLVAWFLEDGFTAAYVICGIFLLLALVITIAIILLSRSHLKPVEI